MPKNDRLSAPEALVLMSLPKFDVRQTLKIGFMGLLAQGVLRIDREDRPGWIRTRHIARLRIARNARGEMPPLAASLIGVVRAAEPDGLMKDVVKQSMREYGKALAGFATWHVIPALIARGLAEERRSRLLGLLPHTSYVRTPAGESEKTRLDGLMREASAIPGFLDRDPAQAAALIAALGGAFILVEALRPHYQAIAAAMRRPEGGEADFGGDAPSDFTGGDLGGLDFAVFDWGAFDGFDADFSDAGGDGGGDAGGDGGGSGC